MLQEAARKDIRPQKNGSPISCMEQYEFSSTEEKVKSVERRSVKKCTSLTRHANKSVVHCNLCVCVCTCRVSNVWMTHLSIQTALKACGQEVKTNIVLREKKQQDGSDPGFKRTKTWQKFSYRTRLRTRESSCDDAGQIELSSTTLI